MELASTFKSEIFRPIVTVLIPGTIAAFPYLLLAAHSFPALADYRDNHEIPYYAIVFLVVVAVGFLLEDVGARIEAHWIDGLLKRRHHPDLYEIWFEYLSRTFEKEPVGQRYLRSILLRMKFELSCSVALPVFFVGLQWLNRERNLFSPCSLVVIGIACLALCVYLVFEAYRSGDLLANIRRVLLGRNAMI
jgi:hypothetical protein